MKRLNRMSKRYVYQYVCFNIRNKGEIDLANSQLAQLAQKGYDLEWSVTENTSENNTEVRLNKLKKRME